jgi:hypothetical protein
MKKILIIDDTKIHNLLLTNNFKVQFGSKIKTIGTINSIKERVSLKGGAMTHLPHPNQNQKDRIS